MTAARVALVAIVVFGAFLFRFRHVLGRMSVVQKLTLFAILTSVSMGVNYVLFQVPPVFDRAWNAGILSIHYFYGVAAAVIFVFCELASAADLARRDRRFMIWILPPIAYLSVIGLVAWFWFNDPVQLLADALRGALLLVLALWSNAQLRSSSRQIPPA